jgi:hypothetical protein
VVTVHLVKPVIEDGLIVLLPAQHDKTKGVKKSRGTAILRWRLRLVGSLR